MKGADTPSMHPDLFVSSQGAHGLAVIGDRWAFMIVRDIYLGIRRFEDLRSSIELNRGTLSSRLKSLQEKGIVVKHPYQANPLRHDYRLTDKGLDLYPLVLMMWSWEQRWGDGQYLPRSLTHKSCGKKMQPIYQCTHCRQALQANEVSYVVRKSYDLVQQVAPRTQRRTKSHLEKSGKIEKSSLSVLDYVGDRWTSLVLAASFFRLQRFDHIRDAIGIGTSVLADRLSLLVSAGIMEKVAYQQRPVRYEYHLSAKGRDLYSHVIAIHEWAERWLIEPDRGMLKLTHLACGDDFAGKVVCSECDQVLYPNQVEYSEV